MKPIIKVENLGKEYRLGTVGTGTIKDDLKRWWYQLRGKEDPFLQVAETNDRAHKGNSNYVWALRDINFEVMPGEVLGVIGRNGAGKSTLLKILSRVTEPTKGRVSMNGRVASLLEVGTGFHPDLTGRENIYLNGAILGMTRKEIDRKFDEIVDFAGVERYIDTPVKRYSSGMHVRLGFAVAAHLEPEILIVDEVLAVGDADFQKKCLGKMNELSKGQGRTILFVSHNLNSIRQLCSRGLFIEKGQIVIDDNPDGAINQYQNSFPVTQQWVYTSNSPRVSNSYPFIDQIEIIEQGKELNFNEPILFSIRIQNNGYNGRFRIGCRFNDVGGQPVGLFFTKDIESNQAGSLLMLNIELTDHQMVPGTYYVDFSIGTGNELSSVFDFQLIEKAIILSLVPGNVGSSNTFIWNNSGWGSIQFKNISLQVLH